jgi:hypothetical protein
MKKRLFAVLALVCWLFLVCIFMLLAKNFDLEIFFVLWLIGMLVIVELLDTGSVQPAYLRPLKYLIAAGIVVFGLIVAQKILEILSK